MSENLVQLVTAGFRYTAVSTYLPCNRLLHQGCNEGVPSVGKRILIHTPRERVERQLLGSSVCADGMLDLTHDIIQSLSLSGLNRNNRNPELRSRRLQSMRSPFSRTSSIILTARTVRTPVRESGVQDRDFAPDLSHRGHQWMQAGFSSTM